MKRLSQSEIDDSFFDTGEEMPLPTPLSTEQLASLRTVRQKLGRMLTDDEREAVLYEKVQAKFSSGIPLQRPKNADAVHAALRAKLLAL